MTTRQSHYWIKHIKKKPLCLPQASSSSVQPYLSQIARHSIQTIQHRKHVTQIHSYAIVLNQARREGRVFPGPAMFGGPTIAQKTLKRVFQMASFWPEMCTKSIFGLGSAQDPQWGSLPRSSRLLVGWWGVTPTHIPSVHTEWGWDRAPQYWFPGPRSSSQRACFEPSPSNFWGKGLKVSTE